MNKTIDELAVELTIELLRYNSSIKNNAGGNNASLRNARDTAKQFVIFKDVLSGNLDPFQEQKET